MSDVKERGILFNGDMVKAVLSGVKTQTRRPIKPQPSSNDVALYGRGITCGELDYFETGSPSGYGFESEDYQWKSPFGKPGDLLWVREAFRVHIDDVPFNINYRADDTVRELYELAGPEWPDDRIHKLCDWVWRPSIHMPRWASRITLAVTAVRVERVQDISEADAIAEGFCERTWRAGLPDTSSGDNVNHLSAGGAFRETWDSIYAKKGFDWAANPWVWVVEFEKLEAK